MKLHKRLVEILGSDRVYYQPSSTHRLKYPCIIYNRERITPIYADNTKYRLTNRFSVTFIDDKPDSDVIEKILGIEYSSFDRPYVSDNLYHYVFSISI